MESTGTLPPAAVPMIVQKIQKAVKLLSPATAVPNNPPMIRVALNAGFLPIRSALVPQKKAPKIKPA